MEELPMKEEKRFIRNRNRFQGIRDSRFFNGSIYLIWGFILIGFFHKKPIPNGNTNKTG